MSTNDQLKEVQTLAFSAELLAFCEAQHAFVDSGESEEELARAAIRVTRETRRLRLAPESLLLAMKLGGYYRSHNLENSTTAGSAASTRYFRSLRILLTSYYSSDARPAERRLHPR